MHNEDPIYTFRTQYTHWGRTIHRVTLRKHYAQWGHNIHIKGTIYTLRTHCFIHWGRPMHNQDTIYTLSTHYTHWGCTIHKVHNIHIEDALYTKFTILFIIILIIYPYHYIIQNTIPWGLIPVNFIFWILVPYVLLLYKVGTRVQYTVRQHAGYNRVASEHGKQLWTHIVGFVEAAQVPVMKWVLYSNKEGQWKKNKNWSSKFVNKNISAIFVLFNPS